MGNIFIRKINLILQMEYVVIKNRIVPNGNINHMKFLSNISKHSCEDFSNNVRLLKTFNINKKKKTKQI